jgi:hypothetical protein
VKLNRCVLAVSEMVHVGDIFAIIDVRSDHMAGAGAACGI